jgi:hypothetical protein
MSYGLSSNFKLSKLFFYVLWDIDLIFGMWLYRDELQFKFKFRSGRMIFGWVMALELVFFVQTFSFPDFLLTSYNILIWYLEYQVNISKDVKKSGELKILTWRTTNRQTDGRIDGRTEHKTIVPFGSLNTQNKGNSNTGRWKSSPSVGSGSHHSIPLCCNIQIPATWLISWCCYRQSCVLNHYATVTLILSYI